MDSRQPAAKRKRGNDVTTQKQAKRRKMDIIALKMESIVEIILGFLDVNSLKVARRVNKLWRREGAKILIAKCYLSIPSPLKGPESARKFNKIDKFKAFLSMAYKSAGKPIVPNITIQTATQVKRWKSIGVLGPHVTCLKLMKFIDEEVELLSHLLHILPNLKYLNFAEEIFSPSKIVKILASEMSKPEKNRDGNHVLVISSLMVSPYVSAYPSLNIEELENVETLSDCRNLMFEELEFSMRHLYGCSVPEEKAAGVPNLIKKFLSRSQKTLKKLTMVGAERYLHLLEFPCMTVLTHMGLVFHRSRSYDATSRDDFPPSFQFSKNVPNLESFAVLQCRYLGSNVGDLPAGDLFSPNVLLEKTGVAPFVKLLEYSEFYSNFTIDALLQIFPNVQEFRTNGTKNHHRMLQSLFKYGKKLKKLEISIYLEEPVVNLDELESSITGFDPKTVERMKKLPKLNNYSVEKLDKLRINPSILDLKELEALTIRFPRGTYLARDFLPKRMLTICGEYAWKLLPGDTKIILEASTYCCSLECIADAFDEVTKLPNVTIKLREH